MKEYLISFINDYYDFRNDDDDNRNLNKFVEDYLRDNPLPPSTPNKIICQDATVCVECGFTERYCNCQNLTT